MDLKSNISKIGSVVASVNELVKLNILQKLTDVPFFYIEPAVLKLRDKKYMVSFCKNLIIVWKLTYAAKSAEMEHIELTLFSKSDGDFLCRYSEIKGLEYS